MRSRCCVNCLYYRHHCCSQDCTDVRETDSCDGWRPKHRATMLSDEDIAAYDRQARLIMEEAKLLVKIAMED